MAINSLLAAWANARQFPARGCRRTGAGRNTNAGNWKLPFDRGRCFVRPPLSAARVAGDLVFTSGQLARGDDGAIVAGGIKAQARRTLDNLVRVLADHGCTPADVVKITAWVTDASHGVAFNEAYRLVFADPYPARSTVVSALLAPDALIEVEAIALRPAATIG